VRALRAVRRYEVAATGRQDVKEERRKEKPAVNLGETLFGVKSPTPAQSNPFASGSTMPGGTNPFAAPGTASSTPTPPQPATASATESLADTFAQKARISSSDPNSTSTSSTSPPEPWPQDPKPFTHSHLDAETEYLDPSLLTSDVPSHARVETNGESSGSSGAEDKTLFESSMDKTFQRFADRLSQNPEQILRYEFGGLPLLYSKTDAIGKLLAPAAENNGRIQTSSSAAHGKFNVQRCANCGAGRVFEMQLTPHAIVELEADDMAIDGMEWGTIIVGVCGEDCQEKGKETVGEVGYVEEWVGVQWEEVVDHRGMR